LWRDKVRNGASLRLSFSPLGETGKGVEKRKNNVVYTSQPAGSSLSPLGETGKGVDKIKDIMVYSKKIQKQNRT
jgi:hypothetical protein